MQGFDDNSRLSHKVKLVVLAQCGGIEERFTHAFDLSQMFRVVIASDPSNVSPLLLACRKRSDKRGRIDEEAVRPHYLRVVDEASKASLAMSACHENKSEQLMCASRLSQLLLPSVSSEAIPRPKGRRPEMKREVTCRFAVAKSIEKM